MVKNLGPERVKNGQRRQAVGFRRVRWKFGHLCGERNRQGASTNASHGIIFSEWENIALVVPRPS